MFDEVGNGPQFVKILQKLELGIDLPVWIITGSSVLTDISALNTGNF
jgi:hypothetical protein